MFSVVILMAGNSTRCDYEVNKVLYKIKDLPIFMYSLIKYSEIDDIDEIVLVTNEKIFEEALEYVKNYSKVKVILGGKTRMESSYLGVTKCKNEYILIHDAARPLISSRDIKNIILRSLNCDCCFAANKVNDTMKMVTDGIKTIDRNALIAASTPQAVRKQKYLALFDKAVNLDYEVTDDASLFELDPRTKIEYYFLEDCNIKVTTNNDLKIIKAMLEGDKNEL